MKKLAFFLLAILCINHARSQTPWVTSGNSISSGDFLGSTNDVDLIFQRNGIQAGLLDTTNTGFGVGALSYFLLSGNSNTAIGVNSLSLNSSGSYNTATGYNSLLNNDAGVYNTANGYNSLYSNISGDSNVAIGVNALYSNSSGINNTAIGYNALYNGTNSNGDIAIGNRALYRNTSGSQNIAIGPNTLYSNNTGTYNIALGYQALYSNTSSYNIGIGYKTLYSNTSGSRNIAIAAYNTGALTANTTGTDNIAIGTSALVNNTTGVGNYAFGTNSLGRNISGGGNTAYGGSALFANTTGNNNIGIGSGAGQTNKAGSSNTAIGTDADQTIDSLTNTTALGYNAKVSQSNSLILGGTGTFAVHVGVGTATPDTSSIMDLKSTNKGLLPPRVSLTATNNSSPIGNNVIGMIIYNTATAGSGTTAVTPGYYYNNGTIWVRLVDSNTGWNLIGNAGTTPGTNFMGTSDNQNVIFKRDNIQAGLLDSSLGNTSWGDYAFNSNTSGNGNLATGYGALHSNTIGGGNVANGYEALYSNTSGANNIGVGYLALYSDTSGAENIAIGEQALYHNRTGNNNTATGTAALFANTSGIENVADGVNALTNNTTGSDNVGIGKSTGSTNLTGDHITLVGTGTDVSTDGYTNSTAIGNGAIVNASNKVRIGNSSVTVIEGQVAYTFPSDARFKYNIKPSTLGLDFIKQLRPVNYNFDTKKFDEHLMQNMPDSIKEQQMQGIDYSASSNIIRTGFLAQDIEAICKKNGYYFDGLHTPDANNKTDHYSLAYSQFVMPLVNAVQQLSAQNDSLQNASLQQQQQIDTLQQQFNDLKNTVSKMQFAMSQCCNSFSSSMQSTTLSKPTVVNLDEARLDQNIPNPYSTATVINYYLPASAANAQLLITDVNGQLLKAVTLIGSGNGQVNINAGMLTSGNYFYTLVVDGQKIDTRQMVLTK
jgi:trimeric autotransporter adhesin